VIAYEQSLGWAYLDLADLRSSAMATGRANRIRESEQRLIVDRDQASVSRLL
jgi:hypothetical protein